VSDVFVLGGAFSYSDTHSTYDQSLGKVDATTYGIAGYGTYYVNEWFIDGFVAYGSVEYDSVRNISIPSLKSSDSADQHSQRRRARRATSGRRRWASAAAFDYAPVSLTPTARLSYIWVKNKSFTEDEPINGVGLAVDSRTIKSLQSSLGIKVSTVVNSAAGVFTPYASLQWVHEFENDSSVDRQQVRQRSVQHRVRDSHGQPDARLRRAVAGRQCGVQGQLVGLRAVHHGARPR
jgi:outer membrane autotransporter protein